MFTQTPMKQLSILGSLLGLLLLLCFGDCSRVYAQTYVPKRIYRGVWVYGLGWSPDSQTLSFGNLVMPQNGDIETLYYDIRTDTVSRTEPVSSQPLTPQEIETFRISRYYSISPNGRYVAHWEYKGADKLSFLMLADRQSVNTVKIPIQAVFFDVAWNPASTAFVIAIRGQNNFVTSHVVYGFAMDVTQFKIQNIRVFTLNDKTYIVDDQVYQVTSGGQRVLLAAYENSGKSFLMVLNMANPIQSQVIETFDGNDIMAAGFSPQSESKLLIENESGVLQYDLATGTSTLLDTGVKSSVDFDASSARDASFSPDGKWLAASHIEEDGQVGVYLLDMVKLLASPPTVPATSTPTLKGTFSES